MIVLLVLLLLAAAIYLEKAGVPGFVKTRMVDAIRARGWDVEFHGTTMNVPIVIGLRLLLLSLLTKHDYRLEALRPALVPRRASRPKSPSGPYRRAQGKRSTNAVFS